MRTVMSGEVDAKNIDVLAPELAVGAGKDPPERTVFMMLHSKGIDSSSVEAVRARVSASQITGHR